jgi:hypothetical protein
MDIARLLNRFVGPPAAPAAGRATPSADRTEPQSGGFGATLATARAQNGDRGGGVKVNLSAAAEAHLARHSASPAGIAGSAIPTPAQAGSAIPPPARAGSAADPVQLALGRRLNILA